MEFLYLAGTLSLHRLVVLGLLLLGAVIGAALGPLALREEQFRDRPDAAQETSDDGEQTPAG